MPLVNELHELRVYRVGANPLQLRTRPSLADEHRCVAEPCAVDPATLVAVDCVRPDAAAAHDTGDGPFLRLCNGLGWLFARKRGTTQMTRMPAERGLWPYQVQNPTVGLALRSHPTDSDDPEWRLYPGDVVYPHEHVVWCDVRVRDGDREFLRVQGTDGWLFTRRDGVDVMRELTARELSRGMLLAEEEAAKMGHGAVVPVLLPPKDLRASAFRHRLRERYHNDRSRVVSFVKDLGAGETSRVDVYYSTGTIAIALNHPREGKTQMFRRGCGMREAEAIFRDPRGAGEALEEERAARAEEGEDYESSSLGGESSFAGLPGSRRRGVVGVGGVYKRRRENDGAYDSNRALRIMGGYVEGMTDATTEDEEVKLRGELRGLDDALRELADQRRILLEHLSHVEAVSCAGAGLHMAAENARAREAREANLLAKRGDRWTAVNAVRERCPELVRRCRSNFRTAKHVALFGPDAWFLSRDDGAYAWENAPEDVRDVERGLEPGDALEYVAVGPEGQRFVRSRAGFVWYGGTRSSRFVAAARDPDRTIRRVAFGVDDAWIILFDDGRWMSQGVPARMCDFIHENETSPVEVALGDDRETWFARCADGEVDFSLPKLCAEAVGGLVAEGFLVKSVALGAVNTPFAWFVRYE